MHFGILVFTRAKPDMGALGRVLNRAKVSYDWFQIGGRWSGVLDDYKPDEDPANVQVCEFCEGTGTTTAAVGAKYPAYLPNVGQTCYQCHGKGERPVWPSIRADHDGDSLPVRSLTKNPAQLAECANTATGEDGKMVFTYPWAHRDKDPEGSKDSMTYTISQLMSHYADGWVTIVDCHN